MTTRNFGLALLKAAQGEGLQMVVSYDGEVDYKGFSAAKAWEAVKACDELMVKFYHMSPDNSKRVSLAGWALMIASLEPDEVVADASGAWVEAYLDDFINGHFN